MCYLGILFVLRSRWRANNKTSLQGCLLLRLNLFVSVSSCQHPLFLHLMVHLSFSLHQVASHLSWLGNCLNRLTDLLLSWLLVLWTGCQTLLSGFYSHSFRYVSINKCTQKMCRCVKYWSTASSSNNIWGVNSAKIKSLVFLEVMHITHPLYARVLN